MSKKRHKKKNTSISTAKKNITKNTTPNSSNQNNRDSSNKPLETASEMTNEHTDTSLSIDKEDFKRISSHYSKKVLKTNNIWTSLASIVALIIFIWNIVKYLYVLIDSIFLMNKAHLPLYLLMSRKNLNFTDLELALSTFMIFLIILSYTNYNPAEALLTLFGANGRPSVLFQLIIMFLISSITCITFLVVEKQITYLDFRGLCLYIILFLLFGTNPYRKYFSRKSSRLVSQIVVLNEEKADEQEINKLRKEKRIPELLSSFLFFFITFITIVAVFLLILPSNVINESLFPSNATSSILLDQNNNVIIADLGDQYVVQSATFDENSHRIQIDSSHYYIIDSVDEIITTKSILSIDINYTY